MSELETVWLSCGHERLFREPVPQTGDLLLCPRCNQYRAVNQEQAVTWANIKAETGDIVEIFRKYEGRLTDETLGQAVRVSENSFARHMGIPRGTFRAWVAATPPDGAMWRRIAVLQ